MLQSAIIKILTARMLGFERLIIDRESEDVFVNRFIRAIGSYFISEFRIFVLNLSLFTFKKLFKTAFLSSNTLLWRLMILRSDPVLELIHFLSNLDLIQLLTNKVILETDLRLTLSLLIHLFIIVICIILRKRNIH